MVLLPTSTASSNRVSSDRPDLSIPSPPTLPPLPIITGTAALRPSLRITAGLPLPAAGTAERATGGVQSVDCRAVCFISPALEDGLKNCPFGLFTSVDAPKDSASSLPPSSALSPISPTESDFGGGKITVDYDTTADTDWTITKKLVAEKRHWRGLWLPRSRYLAPHLSLRPQSRLDLRRPTRSMHDGHEVDSADLSSSSIESVMLNVAAVGSQATNGAPPRSAVLAQIRSSPPSTQSVPSRVHSPSIWKSHHLHLSITFANPYADRGPNHPITLTRTRPSAHPTTEAPLHSNSRHSTRVHPLFQTGTQLD